MSKHSNLDAFKHYTKDVSPDDRYTIIGQFLEGIGMEWGHIIHGLKNIHLEDAIQWLYNDTLTDIQRKATYNREAKKIQEFVDPIFEQGTHWVEYTPTGKKNSLYLTTEGFTYWSMGQHTPKSNLVRSHISRQYMRSTMNKCSPVKKRKQYHIKNTPPRKKVRPDTLFTHNLRHPVTDKLVRMLKLKIQKGSLVYFIWDGTYMKIGLTTRGSQKRVKELQTGASHELSVFKQIQADNPSKLESLLHKKFKHRRIRGEWFNVSKKEIRELVKSMHL